MNNEERLLEVVSSMATSIAAIQSDLASVKSDISELKAGQARLETDLQTVKTDVGTIKHDVQVIGSELNTYIWKNVTVDNERIVSLETFVNGLRELLQKSATHV